MSVDAKATLTAAEVSPAAGVRVQRIVRADTRATNGMMRWLVVLVVSAKAEPGERTVVLISDRGHAAPIKVFLPSHVPELSDFKLLKAQLRPLAIEFSFAVMDSQKDLAAETSLSRFLDCHIGQHGRQVVAADTVSLDPKGPGRARVLSSLSAPDFDVPEGAVCELELRLSDEKLNEGCLRVPVSFQRDNGERAQRGP